jgi:hypothetical protein
MPIVVLMVPGCSCVCTVKKRLTNLDVDSGGAEPNGMGVEKSSERRNVQCRLHRLNADMLFYSADNYD